MTTPEQEPNDYLYASMAQPGELYRVIALGGLPTNLGVVQAGEIVMCLGHDVRMDVRLLTRFGVTQREIPLALMPHWLQRIK